MGNKLKAAREAHRLTQDELAKASGVSRVTICNLENDVAENVTVKTLTKLADALGMTVREIFFP
jgi:transcriptional regulator with XRE-family HTH domain